MKKFWEWMKKKGYGYLAKGTPCCVLDDGTTFDNPTKQMLIGYMNEYQFSKWNIKTIDDLYENLKQNIERTDNE